LVPCDCSIVTIRLNNEDREYVGRIDYTGEALPALVQQRDEIAWVTVLFEPSLLSLKRRPNAWITLAIERPACAGLGASREQTFLKLRPAWTIFRTHRVF
jgi:hypothetical protein